ncbi:DNA repair exonuclease [Sphingomonas albertensis]|uniref:DNA repair exonuclease n=1 Tax=Sphingomonas albertensis TaxID=2762591 RepID=A0ABR7AL06_9SPHN|nr:DNA repair exonuclease [Sphingomonas albertensis]MBC3940627.1 DNA repair exonuclease [Sphingomonas albertensis]
MSNFKFLHAADIHLDSPLLGLGSRTDAPVDRIRAATREALKNLVQFAIDEAVDFVVVAGDLYDGTWKDMKTGIFAMQQFARLGHAGIRTFVILGNHDAESKLTVDLPKPDGVHFFGSAAGEVVTIADLGVAVHGRSFKTAAVLDNLAIEYAPPVPDMFNIAMLHTALEGGHEHAPYAPCRLVELQTSGHDYWALGHVHDHIVHNEHPHVVHPGNVQGRHARETGPKGAVLVQVEDGVVTGMRHVPLDDVRWEHMTIVVADGAAGTLHDVFRDKLDVITREAGGRPVIARVTIDARNADADEIAVMMDAVETDLRAIAAQAADAVWLEKVRLKASRSAPAALPKAIADLIDGGADDATARDALRAALQPLADKLPAKLDEDDPLLVALQTGDWGVLAAAASETIGARLPGERP